jgi:hypothetical protein
MTWPVQSEAFARSGESSMACDQVVVRKGAAKTVAQKQIPVRRRFAECGLMILALLIFRVSD